MSSSECDNSEADDSEVSQEFTESDFQSDIRQRQKDCINVWTKQKTVIQKKYDECNQLEKYREIQRRTKLLYGVKDLKKIIEKSKESTILFEKYHDKEKNMNIEIKKDVKELKDKEKEPKTFVQSVKEFFNQFKNIKLDNFIINSNSEWKQYFDTALLFVIGYTCLTTVFFVSYQTE